MHSLPKTFQTFAIIMHVSLHLIIVLLFVTCSETQDVEDDLPSFAEPIRDIITTAGRNIKLACTIDNLNNYRVAWSHLDTKTLLAMHDKVVTGSQRHRVSQSHSRTWWLEIDNVQQQDAGYYMCQINTSPMKSQVGKLQVVVPPEIDDSRTSIDITVGEKNAVSLMCNAFGLPKPTISWQREDAKKIYINRKKAVETITGPYLNISSVYRKQMGAYLCIASNGVPPSVSKRIRLQVKFPPKIEIPSQLVGTPRGSNIELVCLIEVYPKAMLYWKKDNVMIISNSKFNTVSVAQNSYQTKMKLVIYNLKNENFGTYTCHVESSLGKANGSITLYETSKSALKSSSSLNNNLDKDSNMSHNAMARKNYHSKNDRVNGNGFRVVKSRDSENEIQADGNGASFGCISKNMYSYLFMALIWSIFLRKT